MTERADVRAFGMRIFLVMDMLFFLCFGVACFFARRAAEAWPDVAPGTVPSLALPLVAAAVVAAAALLHRAGRHLAFALLGSAAAVGLLALNLQRAVEGGLTTNGNVYPWIFYGVTMAWAVHLAVALLIAGAHLLRGRTAQETPMLGRFLLFQAPAGALLFLAVLGW